MALLSTNISNTPWRVIVSVTTEHRVWQDMGCYLQWSCGGAGRRLDFICFALTFCDRQQVVRTCGGHGQGLNSDITCVQHELQVSSNLPAKNNKIRNSHPSGSRHTFFGVSARASGSRQWEYIHVCICMYACRHSRSTTPTPKTFPG